MRVLIACEFSGIVRDAFIAKGHDAVSCDLLPSERPGPHIQDDVLKHLDGGWDLMVAFPPCTYLSYVGVRHWNNPGRKEKRDDAMRFFMCLVNAPIEKIVIENPLGLPTKEYRKYDQIIHPYYFGEPFQKRTCLWLKNLPVLSSTNILPKPEPMYICKGPKSKGKKIHWVEGIRGVKERSKERSKTFQGIADAMAEQWG
jgi:hypothetical protein